MSGWLVAVVISILAGIVSGAAAATGIVSGAAAATVIGLLVAPFSTSTATSIAFVIGRGVVDFLPALKREAFALIFRNAVEPAPDTDQM